MDRSLAFSPSACLAAFPVFALLGLCSVAMPAQVPGNAAATPDPAAAVERRISSLDEFPKRSQAGAALLREARAAAAPLTGVQEIERDLESLAPGLESLLAASRQVVQRRPARSLLRQLDSAWGLVEGRLAAWQSALQGRSLSLQKSLDGLRREEEWWAGIESGAETEQIPPQLRTGIAEMIVAIRETRTAVLDRRNHVLALQARVSDLQIATDGLSDELESALFADISKLLHVDSAPIWAARSQDRPAVTSESGQANSQATAAEERVVRYFLRDLLFAVLAQGAFFLAVTLFVFWIRRRLTPRLQHGGADGQLLLRAFDRPISLSILVFGLLLNLLPDGFGSSFSGLVWVIMLVPLIRVVPLTMPPDTRNGIWLLLAWLVADEVVAAIQPESRAVRFAAVIMALAVGAALAVLRRRVLADKTRPARGMVLAGLYFAMGVLGVVVIGQVFGMIELSRLLLYSLARATFAAFALYALYRLLEAGMRVLPVAGPGGAAAQDTETGQWLWRAVRIFVALLFAIIFIRAFELDAAVLAGVKRVFGYHVEFGAIDFTIGAVATFLLVVISATVTSHLVRFLLAQRLFEFMSVARGTGAAISKLVHYAILTAGFLFALAAAGMEMSKFTVLAGGFGVGAAFGLQNILSNFVSGLILLFERPVHVGDQVTVGGTSGEVTDIGIRASTIRTWDGADVVIPNTSLVTSDFTNWTLSDDRRRAEVSVGAAYGSDPEKVLGLLRAAALSHPQVIRHPEPLALFTGFGESSLDFVLRYWTPLASHLAVNSDLHREIYRRFAEEGIEIPFPQRDVNLRPMPAPEPE